MSSPITIVRLYFTETDVDINALLEHLYKKEKASGVTVFRGISGFGESGEIHSSTLIDTAFDLPIVIEFYDDSKRAQEIMAALKKDFRPKHMIYWQANSQETT